MQPLATSALANGALTRENEILAEHEAILDEALPAARIEAYDRRSPWVLRRVVPLLLLVGVGAAIVLVPAGIKDALVTGRSVAHGASP